MTLKHKDINLPPLIRSIVKPSLYKIWYSTIIVTLSSFFFGFCLTATQYYVENFNNKNIIKLNELQNSWFKSISLLGALFGNLFISNFNFNRKLIIGLNNFGYAISVLIMYFTNSITFLLIGKFLMGICIGITCAYVPSYLTEISSIKSRGLIGSFHQLFITLGVLSGFIFDIYISDKFSLGFKIICLFLSIHIILILFITPTVIFGKTGENIKKLLSIKSARKSIFMASLFHFTQQASGVNVIVICADKVLHQVGSDKKKSIFVGLSQFITTIISTGFVEKIGRKPLMAISVGGVCISLSILTFTKFVAFGMYSFMALFALGLGPVTWFITGEIVPPEYRNATNQIATSMNWLFAFITVVTQNYLFNKMGKNMFILYLSVMVLYLVYILVFFKETKGRKADFLE